MKVDNRGVAYSTVILGEEGDGCTRLARTTRTTNTMGVV